MEEDSRTKECKKRSRRSRRSKKRSSSSDESKEGPNDSLTEIVTRMRKLSLQENEFTPEKDSHLTSEASSGDTKPSPDTSNDDLVVDMSLTFMYSPEDTFNTTESSLDDSLKPEPRCEHHPSEDSSTGGQKNDFYPVFNQMTLMKDEHFVRIPPQSLAHSSSLFSMHTSLLPVMSSHSMPDFIPMPPRKDKDNAPDVPTNENNFTPKADTQVDNANEEERAKVFTDRVKLTGMSKSDFSAARMSLPKSSEAKPESGEVNPLKYEDPAP